MKRIVLVCILATAALALLVAIAMKSGSVPTEVHIAQHTVATEVEHVQNDYAQLVSELDAAWREGNNPGESAFALNVQMAEAPTRVRSAIGQVPGTADEAARIQNSFENFEITLTAATELGSQLLEQQASFADGITFLRDAGPQIVEQMREIALVRVAADAFQLIVGTLDYATPDGAVAEQELRRLLVMLSRDQRLDSNMPTEVNRLLASVAAILDNKNDIRSKLTQLNETRVTNAAANLNAAVNDTYQSAVSSADGARTMLAVYAVVLLFAVGFVALRLQNSYREVNSANANLATLNESLEHRVEERTVELSDALNNLKESQVQLVQAEKLSSLGQLVAGISHEINTPLLYLANNATLIQERMEMMKSYVRESAAAFSLSPDDYSDRSEYQTKFVQALRELKTRLHDDELEPSLEEVEDLIRDSIEGLADLTQMAQSLKDYSRLDRAPVGSFNVNTGLDKTLTIARNVVKHKAQVHKFYGDVPEIECAPSQINQVFLNLITNAAQAIDDQGEIVITTKVHDDDHIAIAIADSGCGISPENISRIRDPFFTTKEVGTGTGLGLSIVDEIVRDHGGELIVKSKLGEGSTFTVILPLKQTNTRADAQMSSEDEEPTDSFDLLEDLAEAM